MNNTTWKLATLNVKGMNDSTKFDDIIEWTIENNIDLIILSETKINQTNAFFKFQKYQKNYKSLWTLDDGAPKGTGVGLIIKKNTIGKHIYKNNFLKGKAINLRLKLKGKIDISISGIYGPADHSDKESKEQTLNFIKQNILTSPNKHNIVIGDLNEDPNNHSNCPIINLLTNKNLYPTQYQDEEAYTWQNSQGTKRLLDHIYLSAEFLDIQTTSNIEQVSHFLQTDHEAPTCEVNMSHFSNSQSLAR